MADNVDLPAATGKAASDEVTYSGDSTAQVQLMRVVEVTGSEGSKTVIAVPRGAGAVTSGTERVTLASDDPAVVSLAILDDWDESDRAKVNTIVGQAGVAAGAGAVGVTVQRFTLASDDPAVVALQILDDWDDAADACKSVGNVAHDAADAGAPQKIGYKAIAHGADPTAVAADDRSNAYCNRHGIPWTIGGHPNVVTIKHANITTAVTDTAIITAGAGEKIVVTGICVTLDNASTVFPTLLVGFGAANTPTTTGVILAHGGVPAGGGVNRGDGSGILGIGADAEDLRVTTTGNATGNGLQLVVTYYKVPS